VRIRETITISGVGGAAEHILDLLSSAYPFEVSGSSLLLHKDYSPGVFEDVEERLKAARVQPRLFHSIFPEFDDADYADAPLLDVAFPDVSIGGEVFVVRCPACGTRRTERECCRQVRRVNSNAQLASVNGAVEILSYSALDALLRAGLSGLEARPFDAQGRFSYLAARTELGEFVIRPDETRGYRGRCTGCGGPLFDVHFGPFRFLQRCWSGDDFVWAEFIDHVVVSQAAYAELLRLEAGVMRLSPVLLE